MPGTMAEDPRPSSRAERWLRTSSVLPPRACSSLRPGSACSPSCSMSCSSASCSVSLRVGGLMMGLYNFELITAGGRYTAEFFINWFVFISALYLYFKYTGQTMGRSLAQRGFRIAIVHDNGTMLRAPPLGPSRRGQNGVSYSRPWTSLVRSARHLQRRLDRRRISNRRGP